MSDYFTILTVAGEGKFAAAASGGPAIDLTQVAVGDGNGTAYTPTQAQTTLVNENYRASIASAGYSAPNLIVIEAVIPANTPDSAARPSGGWNIVEAGVFDSTGTMIAVAKMPVRYKPLPSSGTAEDMTIRLVLAISNAASVVVSVDSSALIGLNRLDRLPFIAVDSATTTAPPVSPEIGATYLLPAGSTGVWGGQDGKIAHWNGAAWIIVTPWTRTVVGVADVRAFLEWTGTAWVPLALGGAVTSLAGSATLTAPEAGLIIATAPSAATVLTLPAAASTGSAVRFKIKRPATDTGGYAVSVLPAGSDLFQPGALGASALASNPCTLLPGETLEIWSDGSANWWGEYDGGRTVGFTASGTFVCQPFRARHRVKVIGGGGGGASLPVSSGNVCGACGGGGGVALGEVVLAPGSSTAVTVGGPGSGGIYPGTAGGTSSFGSLLAATGGQPGNGFGSATLAGGTSGVGTGGSIDNYGLGDGSAGGPWNTSPAANGTMGIGGGPGGQSGTSGGYPGRGPGGGGGGGSQGVNGGNGFRGEVVVEML